MVSGKAISNEVLHEFLAGAMRADPPWPLQRVLRLLALQSITGDGIDPVGMQHISALVIENYSYLASTTLMTLNNMSMIERPSNSGGIVS